MGKKESQVTISEYDEILPIEIKAKDFFLDLQPWKEGKLATVDGWGQFSEMTFLKENKFKVTPLVKFPRMQMDKDLYVWPEANLFFSHNGKMMFIADVESKKTKDFIPFLTWTYDENAPILLDAEEGLVVFQYTRWDARGMPDGTYKNIYYNYMTDQQYEDPELTDISYLSNFGNDLLMTYIKKDKSEGYLSLYNWRTKKLISSKLTDKLNALGLVGGFGGETFMYIKNPGMLFDGGSKNGYFKITWNYDFSEVNIIPISHLLPDGKRFDSFYLSLDGKWATVYLIGYKGLYGEDIVRRVFFHLDERYPGGISMSIFADGYEENHWVYGSFFEHPEYGPCYAHEYYKEDQQYLRLYKMSDVVTLINKKLLDKGNKLAKK